MASRRSSSHLKNSSSKEQDSGDNNGYVQILVTPLEQVSCSAIFTWLGITKSTLTVRQCGVLYGVGALVAGVCIYQLLLCDLGYVFQRFCGLTVPLFSILCGYFWMALLFRKTWSSTSVYALFCACVVGEFLGQCIVSENEQTDSSSNNSNSDYYLTRPAMVAVVLITISIVSLFSSLDIWHSAIVILYVSFTRFLACTSLIDLSPCLRPFISYSCGIGGIIVAKYTETVFKPTVSNLMTQDGKIPVIKRGRTSSSAGVHNFGHKGRRTSLPALIQKSQGTIVYDSPRRNSMASYDMAAMGEAHGLITDMLADTNLPPHIISGLRAVANLLDPPNNITAHQRPKMGPFVSLVETTNGSDTEEIPFTGERPSSLPKRLRRSLPPGLLRRMSTSTWTTTTSATGLPTLEPEPSRKRSASFRHSIENTPSSTPGGSRSNSPSPSSTSVTSLAIPKSRSFSSVTPIYPNSLIHLRRNPRERKTICSINVPDSMLSSSQRELSPPRSRPVTTPTNSTVIGVLTDKEGSEEGTVPSPSSKICKLKDGQGLPPLRRINLTSDYESCDSPSGSDFSDNVMTSEDISRELPCSPTKHTMAKINGNAKIERPHEIKKVEEPLGNLIDKEEEDDGDDEEEEPGGRRVIIVDNVQYDLDKLETDPLLNRLIEWDYPIFELDNKSNGCILSQVAYKLFLELGLFETFKIPLNEFMSYFHALEEGYRDKPYHNRMHAADVLHGVYFLSSQPIPGFVQIIPDTDPLIKGLGSQSLSQRPSNFSAVEDSYGIMGGNFPALELMALYAAAAVHDYDHPGRTNAFLVTTYAPQAILYNDRSVLENHHAAAAWNLFLSKPEYNWLVHLDKAEFRRFRFLVIEAILATDLKRHFEILAEFNAKANDDDAPGIDWHSETDRLMVAQMCIKLADINGPCKIREIHMQWTTRITEEFYEQGDEEASLGLPISPFMDRNNPQLAKLQESFITHLVAPLCNTYGEAGLLPGHWVESSEGESEDGSEPEKVSRGSTPNKDTDAESDQSATESDGPGKSGRKETKKILCLLTKHIRENHDIWVARIKEEERLKELSEKNRKNEAEGLGTVEEECKEKEEMEPIEEESSLADKSTASDLMDSSTTDKET